MNAIPMYDLYAPDPESYKEAYLPAARAAIAERLELEAREASERAPSEPSAAPGALPRLASVISVTARFVDGAWEAEASVGDAIALGSKIARALDAKAEEMLEADAWYNELRAAAAFRPALEGALQETGYASVVALERVSLMRDGGFAARVIYPDPEDVYSVAAWQCYDAVALEIKVSGEQKYYTFEPEELAGMYAEGVAGQLGRYARRPVISSGGAVSSAVVAGFAGAAFVRTTLMLPEGFKHGGPAPFCEDIDALRREIGATSRAGLAGAVARINAELVAQEAELPQTGALSGQSSGHLVHVKPLASGDRYLAFYSLPYANGNDFASLDIESVEGVDSVESVESVESVDLDIEGELALTAFIRAGEPLDVRLPAGAYKLVVGSGGRWYGEPAVYGPRGAYALADVPIAIRTGYAYTLELEGSDALPLRPIQYPFGEWL